MSYQVIARKWRPQRFDEVIGQGPVTATLRFALREGRVAPVILFTGIRGTGKTTLARILVKALNCLSPREDGEPCNTCENCTEIMAGRSPDVFEIDGASNNSVDDVRILRENIVYGPVKSKRKAYIIDEVHMLSKSAFNALLKTLEEPPEHTVFILATTDPQKIPATVLSRCQRYDLRRLTLTDIVTQLEKILAAEKVPFERDALYLIAREGEGSMRDAQTLVEQMLTFGERRVTCEVVSLILGTSDRTLIREIVGALIERDADRAVATVRELYKSGKALERAARDLLLTIHGLVLQSALNDDRLVEASDEEKQWLRETAPRQGTAEWLRLFDFWSKQYDPIVRSDYALMLFEASVVMAASFPTMSDIKELIDRLDGVIPTGAPANAPTVPAGTATPHPVPPPKKEAVPPVSPATEPRSSSTLVKTELPDESKPPEAAVAPLAGWREFLDRFLAEDPMLGSGLKNAAYDESADGVTVQASPVLEAALRGKKKEVQALFTKLTGGRTLRFVTAETPSDKSVAQEENREEAERKIRVEQELRNDPTVKSYQQEAFDLRKVGFDK